MTDNNDPWRKSDWLEAKYARQLRLIVQEVNRIASTYDISTIQGANRAQEALQRYSVQLEPWAILQAKNIFDALNNQDLMLWRRQAKQISKGLKEAIFKTPTGEMQRQFIFDQVDLIKTLPTNAGLKAQEYAQQNLLGSARHESKIAMIQALGDLTIGQARRIARTETSKQSSALTIARGISIDAYNYIWRTSKDRAVRLSHQHMEGIVCSLTIPPQVEPGKFYHAGQIYNCFVGSTKIFLDDGCKNLFRYWYEGDILSITVDSGEIFNCTPNHPVLTANGWRRADCLEESDNLLCSKSNCITMIGNNKTNFETTFDQLFSALSFASCSYIKTSAKSAFNFHGDIPANRVDIIRITEDLLIDFITRGSENSESFNFAYTDSRVITSNKSSMPEIGKPCISGLSNSINELLFRHGSHAYNISVGLSSDSDAIFNEPGFDPFPTESNTVTNRDNAFSTNISVNNILNDGINEFIPGIHPGSRALDKITDFIEMGTEIPFANSSQSGNIFNHQTRIEQKNCVIKKISREFFNGHVYTLESNTGNFSVTSARIISKNCRCIPEIIIPGIDRQYKEGAKVKDTKNMIYES